MAEGKRGRQKAEGSKARGGESVRVQEGGGGGRSS